MIDVSKAVYCIRSMRENGTYRDQKIGRVTRDIKGLIDYKIGEVVIFTEYKNNRELCIERPMSSEQISMERTRGSLLTTVCCTVGVPKKYIEEIKL